MQADHTAGKDRSLDFVGRVASMPFISSIWRKYLVNRKQRVFRASVSMFFYAAAGTILAAAVYYLSGVEMLSAFVLFAGIVFFAALVVYFKGFYKAGIIVALIAVSIISVSGDVFMGIGCGAHYFLLAGVMLFVSVDKSTVLFRFIAGAACFVEFVLVCVFLTGAQPLTPVPPIAVTIIDKINLIVAFGAIGFTLHNYVIAVVNQEITHREYSLKLLDQANSDQLTGLPNRRFTYRQLELLATKPYHRDAGFVIGLADIDDFKHLNDTYGHLCGDDVLIQAGALMRNSLRKNDIVGRWGGEEFLIVMPGTGLDEGLTILERLRAALETATFFVDGHKVSINITIGVSAFKKTAMIKDLIREADENLYRGKNQGKNRIITAAE
jgi:diguanylate cyclase (GGDEF)-like protein